jgi:hypothetical protein
VLGGIVILEWGIAIKRERDKPRKSLLEKEIDPENQTAIQLKLRSSLKVTCDI